MYEEAKTRLFIIKDISEMNAEMAYEIDELLHSSALIKESNDLFYARTQRMQKVAEQLLAVCEKMVVSYSRTHPEISTVKASNNMEAEKIGKC